jgi:hypothetical protein
MERGRKNWRVRGLGRERERQERGGGGREGGREEALALGGRKAQRKKMCMHVF